jgi:putative ABC transport system permease protein
VQAWHKKALICLSKLTVMFKNYFKIIFRNLRKYKNYTLINILGMGIGIAAMVWGYQDYRFAFTFDDFHPHQEQVYRGLIYKKDADGLKGSFPMAAVQMAKNDFAGIKAAVRYDSRGVNVRYNKDETFSEQVNFTDPGFFELWNFPLVAGSNDLNDHDAVFITERLAKKYFGSQDPIGKALTFYAGENYSRELTVKGVLRDLPMKSTFRFDILTNFDNQLKEDGQKIAPNDWSWFIDAAYFYIPDPATAARLGKDMAKYLPLQNTVREDAKVSAFKLVLARDIARWRDVIGSNAQGERPSDAAAFGPLVLAFLIFLSACLNFSNTTVAHAGRRLKEIGMRKVMGSTYGQLIWQLLAECSIIVGAAILLSVLLNWWWLPAFNSMFGGVKVEADYFHDGNLLVFIGCMLVGATLLAGTYPAFYLSRFSPTSIFRGSVKFGGSNLFSRLMLGLQLSIAIITVIASIAFARNAAFQRNYDYGYNIESSMIVRLNDSTAYAALKNELSAIPEITSVTGTRRHIGFGYPNVIAEAEGQKKEISMLETGQGYLQSMGLKMAMGRGFDANMKGDYANALQITEKTAALYGWNANQALGKQIHIDSTAYTVVGVLKDFHSETLFEPLRPLAMKLVKENRFQFLVVQANPRDLTAVFGRVKDAWKKLYPTMPFNGFYQNLVKEEAFRTSNSIATIFLWFGLVSILLTATGLFALVSLTVLKKMREIALRKVVGASPHHILLLINKGYFWVFIVSGFLGCYSGWALTKLLLDMIFKINVGVSGSSLIWSMIVLFVIAAVTSGIKVVQAVRTNPVKLLRSE